MASKNVYQSAVSRIRVLRYRTREPEIGESPNAGPFLFLLVWGEDVCGTTSFSSFFAAWSEVQVIDADIMRVLEGAVDEQLAKAANVANTSEPLGLQAFPANLPLQEVLDSRGIDEEWKDDYDFDVLLKRVLDAIEKPAILNAENADKRAADMDNDRGKSVTRKQAI